jgi:hypothetical protein
MQLREEILQTLCVIVHQLGESYLLFVPMMGKVLERSQCSGHVLDHYTALVAFLKDQVALGPQHLLPPRIKLSDGLPASLLGSGEKVTLII